MKLFVGLGNPGAQYARHRHNVGYVALDKIASEHSLGPWRKRFQGETAEGILGGERVVLLKPTTYMNDSGRSVGEAARFLKIDVERHLRLSRRDRPRAGQAESKGRRRQRRPQRAALHHRPHGQ